MKKFIALALILALASSFAACKKLDTTETNTITKRPYYVDAEGNTIYAEAQTNEDGDVEFFVTNENGESSKLDRDDLVVEEITNADQYLEILDIIENNPEQILDEVPPANLEIADGVIPDDNFSEIEVELDENGNPSRENLSYKEIVDSGEFTIEGTLQVINSEGTTTCPFKIIKNEEAMYLETAIPQAGSLNTAIKAGILSNSENTYLLVPSVRAYLAADGLTLDEFLPVDEIYKDAGEELGETYSHSGTVEYNGKTYVCDVYENDGATSKYYYDEKGNLVRIETTDGTDTVIQEIKSISSDVDESKLVLPKNYLDFTSFNNGDIDVNALVS